MEYDFLSVEDEYLQDFEDYQEFDYIDNESDTLTLEDIVQEILESHNENADDVQEMTEFEKDIINYQNTQYVFNIVTVVFLGIITGILLMHHLFKRGNI